mmetsp:Transcript_51916/g.135484  ORF Transcript_51916/g.135484 Transcript_51916/m.135484 type:complete len:1224 (-) Transcript_51916:361-4032(-)
MSPPDTASGEGSKGDTGRVRPRPGGAGCGPIRVDPSRSLRLEVGLQVRVLAGELEQHGVVEELVDGHVLAHALAPAGLDHELAREVRRRLRLQGAQHDGLVEGVARHDGPVVKHLEAEGLPLGVGAEVGLEPERVHDRDVRLDGVKRRARLGGVLGHVTAAARQHRVNGGDTVGGGLDLDVEHGLHQPRRRHQQRRVRHAPRRRDHLAAAAVDGGGVDGGVEDLELDVADRLVAERALPRRPLEPLHDAVLDGRQELLVDLRGQGVVDEHVGSIRVGTKGPHRPGGEHVPVVLALQEARLALAVPREEDVVLLDVLREALLERLGDEGELVAAVGRLREALEGGGLHDGLGEGDGGVRDLDLDVGVHAAEVVHHAVEVELPGPDEKMLAGLLDLGAEKRVRLVDLAEAVKHLGQLGGVEGLQSDLDDALGAVLQRPEDAGVVDRDVRHRRRLDDGVVDALHQHQHPRRRPVDGKPVSALVDPDARNGLNRHVLVIIRRVPLPQHPHRVADSEGARHDAAEGVEVDAVWLVVELDHVGHDGAVGFAAAHGVGQIRVEPARVRQLHLVRGALQGRRQVVCDRVHQPRRPPEEGAQNRPEERAHVPVDRLLLERDAQLLQRRRQLLHLLPDALGHHLVEGLEDEVDEGALRPRPDRALLELAGRLVEPEVAPQPLRELLGGEAAVCVGVDGGEGVEGEGEAEERGGEDDVAQLRVEGGVGPARVSHERRVDLLDHVLELEVGVGGRQLELQDEPVDLVDDEHDGQPLLARLADEAVGVEHEAVHGVHHQQHPVCRARRRRHLVGEVDVAGSVEEVQHEGLALVVGQQHRHGHRLDAELPLLLVDAGVGVAQVLAPGPFALELVLQRRAEGVRLPHQHIDEARLAAVEVARDAHVADQLGVAAKLVHVNGGVGVDRDLLLNMVEVLGPNRGNNWFLEGLGVFILHQGLRLGIHFLGIRIVLFVLMKDDSIRHTGVLLHGVFLGLRRERATPRVVGRLDVVIFLVLLLLLVGEDDLVVRVLVLELLLALAHLLELGLQGSHLLVPQLHHELRLQLHRLGVGEDLGEEGGGGVGVELLVQPQQLEQLVHLGGLGLEDGGRDLSHDGEREPEEVHVAVLEEALEDVDERVEGHRVHAHAHEPLLGVGLRDQPSLAQVRRHLRHTLVDELHVHHGIAHESLGLTLPVPRGVLWVRPDLVQHLGHVLGVKQQQQESAQIAHTLMVVAIRDLL